MKRYDSYGIAICRINNNVPQILLCRRRVTYEYNEFVTGKYNINNWSKIYELINSMTANEKINIKSLDFNKIWWHNSLRNVDTNFADDCKLKFDTNFSIDRGTSRLIDLINKSQDAELLWEIPKGRSGRNEKTLDTAIRETSEEVGVNSSDYRIIFDINTFKYTTTAYKVQYKFEFYIANYTGAYVDLSFNNRHNYEIDAVRWWSLPELQFYHQISGQPNADYIKNITIPLLKKFAKWHRIAVA